MITEDHVSFETAKLLKEKGFPQELGEEGCINTIPYYTQNGGLVTCDINTIRQRFCPEAASPTLQMAMKWLREVHNIFIQVELYKYDDYCFEVFQNTHSLIVEKDEVYNSYEAACEAAIKYCLENLI